MLTTKPWEAQEANHTNVGRFVKTVEVASLGGNMDLLRMYRVFMILGKLEGISVIPCEKACAALKI